MIGGLILPKKTAYGKNVKTPSKYITKFFWIFFLLQTKIKIKSNETLFGFL